MLKFYYKNPTLPLEWGIKPIKEECPDLCLVDLQNCHRGFEVPVNIYVEEEEAKPIVALDSQGNVIEKEQEEEIRFLLEGIDFEELGGNEIEGDGRKDCEGRGGEGRVEFEGDRRKDCERQGIEGQGLAGDEFERFDCEGRGVELGVDDNLANNEWEYVAENLTENFTEIPVQQKDSNMTSNNVTEIPVENMPDKGKRKLYERFLNESSSEFDDSSDEEYVQSDEGSDSEAPSLVLEDIECQSNDDIFLSKDPSKKELIKKLKRVLKDKNDRKKPETRKLNLGYMNGLVRMRMIWVVLRDWCIRNGVDLEFLRNEAARVTAKCKVRGCEWRIHASPVQGGPTFQIKTIKGGVGTEKWSFISNRQKGLVEALKDLVPESEHRFCLRHMYENFKVKFKSVELKEYFWKAASTANKREFDHFMKKIEELDPKIKDDVETASEWLKKINP
ncbi:UNVERIFIED_CONTAM: hypothetical protein Slati_1152000 [Sesamum latifolium]|uniref:Transposase MuDR plant domain-containing protein n=1 Tax=Sesamum latifolium TaxID=2727402 RepID=A0AAW2XET1_9LAMI